MLRLTPIIELYPMRFAPDVPDRAPDETFEAHWTRALAHVGISGIEPRGAWYAALDDLVTTAAIELALDVQLDRHRKACVAEHYDAEGSAYDRLQVAHLDEVADQVGALDGGYELTSNGEVLSFPACCGDLANVKEWEAAAECTSAEPVMLWIGHPWQCVRLDSGVLDLYAPSEGGIGAAIARLSPEDLRRAVRGARDAVGQFAERLAPVVRSRFGAAKAPLIVRSMLGR